jgi:CDP-glycerol glycerophosphotransferase (TagB/SpsB family)
LIKHWNIPELEDKYPDYFQWVSEANERARVYDHVRIIDPKTDLYDLISEVDLLVTDQSSTIYDAMAAGIPSLAVRGWPMRTQRSSSIRRLEPSQDVTFVAEVDTLRQTIEAALSADAADQVLELRGRVLTNFGTAADEILDLIELTVAAWERGAPIRLQVKPARVHRLLGPTRRVSYEVQRFARRVRSKLRQRLRGEA